MNDYDKFRAEFKSFVYVLSEIKDSEARLKSLYAWDKNGSHTKVILKELEVRGTLKEKLLFKLKGVEYDEWKRISKTISLCVSRLKAAEATKAHYERKLTEIKLP